MPTSIYDLPPEILYTIADLVRTGSLGSSTVRSCASTCRLLRAVFRPFVWSRLEVSELYARNRPVTLTGKGKQRVLGEMQERGKGASQSAAGQPEDDCRPEASFTGSSDGVCAATHPPFIRALAILDDILATSPEIATYVKELEVDLPNEDGLGVPSRPEVASVGAEEEGTRYPGEWKERGRDATWEERLFPHIAQRLTNLRKLRVSVGSLRCQRRCPPRFRIDWDVLSSGLRTGFTTLFRGERLEEVEFVGVVVPPRMLFGHSGVKALDNGVLSRLKKLDLVAYCPLSTRRVEQIEDSARGTSVGTVLGDAFSSFQATSPLYSALPVAPTPPTLTSLHLGFCDSEFLRYISMAYSDAFKGLKSLSLNIIEKDLAWCQGFLDVITDSAATVSSPPAMGTAPGSIHGLESFDCTIRCNTQASFYGLFTLHALDFSRCTSLKHLSLKYLLLSQVTEAVKRAMEVNIATALSTHRAQRGLELESGSVGELPQKRGVETMHLVIDWAFNGDLILLDAFKDLDKIVEDAYYTSTNGVYGESKRKSLNLEMFKIEATHWPCPDAGNCGFKREVTAPPPQLVRSPSMSGSLASPTPSTSDSAGMSRRPAPLRASSSPHPYRNVGIHNHHPDEGSLAKFFPFLTNLQGLEDGVDFKSRYVLEHRRELGPGIMM